MKIAANISLALLIFLLPATCFAQTKEQAEIFVRHLYSGYEHPSSKRGPYTLGRDATLVFSPSLLLLIRSDAREAHGEVGRLDGDPICDCQDFDGLRLTRLTLQLLANGHASAKVTLHYPQPEERTLTLQLLWTRHGWRVNDISTVEVPSLRQMLQSPLR